MGCRETTPLAVLRQPPVQDTEPDQVFDDLTLLASQICGTPIALMGCSHEIRPLLRYLPGRRRGAHCRA